MAGLFTRWRLILSAVLVAVLPSVSSVDYNTCRGGIVDRTCQNMYSSHCCKSGGYLSATCCWNACTYSAYGGWRKMYCTDITESMCCRRSKYGFQSCCNRESYSRTSSSSVNGDYLKPTYGSCSGISEGNSHTVYCTQSLSTDCCSAERSSAVSCCLRTSCVRSYGFTQTCSGTSTYCCSLSQSCCDSTAYNYEAMNSGHGAAAIGGGVFGGIALLLFMIVVPVTVVCCAPKGRGPDAAAGTSADAEASNSPSNSDNAEKSKPDVVPDILDQPQPPPEPEVTILDQPQPPPEPEVTQVEQPLSSSVSSSLNQ